MNKEEILSIIFASLSLIFAMISTKLKPKEDYKEMRKDKRETILFVLSMIFFIAFVYTLTNINIYENENFILRP